MKNKYLVMLLTPMLFLNAESTYLFNIDKNISKSINIKNIENGNNTEPPSISKPKSCLDILNNHNGTGNGVYKIYPDGSTEINAWCDMNTEGGGWTLISKFNPSNLVCNYRTGTPCNTNELSNNNPNLSALMDLNLVRAFMIDSNYQELRAVGGGYDAIVRTTEKDYPLDSWSTHANQTLQCRNTGASSWNNYNVTINNSEGVGLMTWTTGTNYIGLSGSKICGDAITFSSSDNHTDRSGYQYINAGYTSFPSVSGVFYIR